VNDGKPSMTSTESQIEQDLIARLQRLKYHYRDDIRDRAALEANFRAKFEALNHVKLSDGEFLRLFATNCINDAVEYFDKGKKKNQLLSHHINKIVETYQYRREEARFSRRVSMAEIKRNEYNLNISCYVSTAQPEEEIDIAAVHQDLILWDEKIKLATARHNTFLAELGLPPLP